MRPTTANPLASQHMSVEGPHAPPPRAYRCLGWLTFATLLAALSISPLTLAASTPATGLADSGGSASQDLFQSARQHYIERLENNNLTGDADTDFAAFLVPQHESGVELARVEMAHGHNAALRKIASGIIAHADRATPVHSSVPPLAPDNLARGTIYQIMSGADQDAIDAFLRKPEGDIDEQFAHLMDNHHRRAITYANTEASYGQDDKLIAMAHRILKGQEAEHAIMQKMLPADEDSVE